MKGQHPHGAKKQSEKPRNEGKEEVFAAVYTKERRKGCNKTKGKQSNVKRIQGIGKGINAPLAYDFLPPSKKNAKSV